MGVNIQIATLPDNFVEFRPMIDIMPLIPVFFLALAFFWQASIGFK